MFGLIGKFSTVGAKRFAVAILFVFLVSIGAFAQNDSAAKDDQTAQIEFTSDGCTGFPDGNYLDCCVAHDREYFAGGNWKQRWRSDKKLFRCVAAKSKFYNKPVAVMMWLGVRVFGVPCLKADFSWGFGKKVSNGK